MKRLSIEHKVVPGKSQVCSICEEGVAILVVSHQEFRMGAWEAAIFVRAVVPVWSCAACGLEYVDQDGEVAQHDAACRKLGRLTSDEMKAIRRSASLSEA